MKKVNKESKRVLWVSRHDVLPAQKKWLGEKLGVTEVVKDAQPFSGAEEIAQRFRDGNYDEIVVVAPLSVMGKLTELGVRPLWAEMKEVGSEAFDAASDVLLESSTKTRHMRFVTFRRVKRLVLEFEEV